MQSSHLGLSRGKHGKNNSEWLKFSPSGDVKNKSVCYFLPWQWSRELSLHRKPLHSGALQAGHTWVLTLSIIHLVLTSWTPSDLFMIVFLSLSKYVFRTLQTQAVLAKNPSFKRSGYFLFLSLLKRPRKNKKNEWRKSLIQKSWPIHVNLPKSGNPVGKHRGEIMASVYSTLSNISVCQCRMQAFFCAEGHECNLPAKSV